jgi:hypothetical protein
MRPSLLGIQNKDYQSVHNLNLLLSMFSILLNISDSSHLKGPSENI